MASTRSGILDSETPDHIDLNGNAHDSDAWPARKTSAYLSNPQHLLQDATSWLLPQSWRRPIALRPTAYLDGLRGFAAVLVYWHHHQLWVHDRDTVRQNSILSNSFGYEGKYHFAALPGIRTFFTGGHFAVSTFFVLSGYVLSIKPLTLIEQNDTAALGSHLASAVFRRWVRLFLPLFATIVVYATSWHLLGLWVDGAEPKDSWLSEMWSLYAEFKNFSFIYKEGGDPWISYNFHAWSIPVEMRGSMVIFSAALAFSQCTLRARLLGQLALIFYFLYIADGWYCAMFMAGMTLCHLDILAKLDRLPGFISRLKPYRTIIFYHLFAISIYLGGIPGDNTDVNHLAKNRGWYFLSFLKPQAVFDFKWFYLFWAAIFLVSSVSQITWLKRFFETRPCQYAGKVSYALYLVHGPVLWIIGDRIYFAVGWEGSAQMEHIPSYANILKLPRVGPLGLELSFLLPNLILFPLTICLADFVTRAVDTPSVKFAQWLYKRTLPEAPPKQNRG